MILMEIIFFSTRPCRRQHVVTVFIQEYLVALPPYMQSAFLNYWISYQNRIHNPFSLLMHERESFSCLSYFNEKYGNTGYGVIGSFINILNLCLNLICMSPSPYLSALDLWLFLDWNIKFVELNFSNKEFQNSSTDQQGGCVFTKQF